MVVQKNFGKAQSRLALYVLNKLNLVPEHVETRALYNKVQQPTMEQVRCNNITNPYQEWESQPGSGSG